MKVIYTTDNNVEAAMIEGLLKEAQIPVYLSPLPPLELLGASPFHSPKGYELVVPDNRAAEATHVVEDYLASLKEEGASE